MGIVTTAELRLMKPGDVIIRSWDHPKEARNAQGLCSQVSTDEPELNIRLKTRKNYDKKTLTIIAERKEKKQ